VLSPATSPASSRGIATASSTACEHPRPTILASSRLWYEISLIREALNTRLSILCGGGCRDPTTHYEPKTLSSGHSIFTPCNRRIGESTIKARRLKQCCGAKHEVCLKPAISKRRRGSGKYSFVSRLPAFPYTPYPEATVYCLTML